MGGGIVRRGQLLSMDALVSIVLVIMILGTVSATSESLRSGITSMIGWYERSNIADNMLDVLTKNPGVPEDWERDPSSVEVVGLAGEDGTISWEKVQSLIYLIAQNNTRAKSSLLNMSMGNDFELVLYRGGWNFSVNYTWNPNQNSGYTPPLQLDSFNASYVFPADMYYNGTYQSPWNLSSEVTPLIIPVVNLNGTVSIGANSRDVMFSMNSSPWVLYSQRRTSMEVFIYNASINVTSNRVRLIMSGSLLFAVPSYARLRITLPDTTGYSLFIVEDGVNLKLLAVWRTDGNVEGALWEKGVNGSLSIIANYSSDNDSLTIPWSDLFESNPAEEGSASVGLWVYSKNLPWVYLEDLNNINTCLGPKMDLMLINLWVWGG